MYAFMVLLLLGGCCPIAIEGFLFYPRKCSFGYLAAVAMPLELPNRNIFVAFNFESNYALPSNDTYNDWIDRVCMDAHLMKCQNLSLIVPPPYVCLQWQLDQGLLGIGNNVTAINGRRHTRSRYTRSTFYYTLMGYLEHFQLNGSACLLRTICEVAADAHLDVHNGLLGSIFKILFMPSNSRTETLQDLTHLHSDAMLAAFQMAEYYGKDVGNCALYMAECPHGPLDLLTSWF